MSNDLVHKRCIPCEGGDIVKFTKEEAEKLLVQVPEWRLNEEATRITRAFPFKDFKTALQFADAIGVAAEEEWHHPKLEIAWGRVEVSFQTNAIKGLSENDFIMAAKVDALQKI